MREALSRARLYLVAPAELRAGSLADLVPDLAGAGVDVIQLRMKEAEAGDVIRAGEPVRAACGASGIPFIVNDRPDVAVAIDADGVHVGQNDVPPHIARAIVGPDRFVGLSTHSDDEIESARTLGDVVDYIGVGPVRETPTKPGRPGTGLELVAHAAARALHPWFVTGGMAPDTLADVLAAGARRIVVVRAIVEAPEPVAVAAQLALMLREVPL